ncbi:uncharacterized protein [Drosophila bipectinata]|uniref:uncharacterized protein n=1 Tax=Drosophila bipectinata TaxID=42026 RepID=UPI001C894A0A|nr:uncharacterized protein LOC108132400 [Drosophila bipectinata]
MIETISRCIRYHRCGFVFLILQVTLMLSLLEVRIEIEATPGQQTFKTRMYAFLDPMDLLYSPLYSGFAMGAMFYGYGLLYLRSKGPLEGFLSRLRSSAMSVWQKCSPLMILPWCIKIVQGLCVVPVCLWLCLFNENLPQADHFVLLALLAIVLWLYVLTLAITSFILAMRLNIRLLRIRTIGRSDHELRAYAQGINELLGFEMLLVN